MTPDEALHRRRTAIHKAAHACVSQDLGIEVEYASVRPGRNFDGVAVNAHAAVADLDRLGLGGVMDQPPALRADVERRVVVMLAGEAAALVFAEPDVDGWDVDPVEVAARGLAALPPRVAELAIAAENSEAMPATDADKAGELAAALTGPTGGAAHYLAWLSAEAEFLVRQRRDAILRVADALEAHAILTGDQIAAITSPAATAATSKET